MKSNSLTHFYAILLSGILTGCGLGAQTAGNNGEYGKITGQVVEAMGNTPLANVPVKLIVANDARVISSQDSSDADLKGVFTFSDVPAGLHTVVIDTDGYARSEFTVRVGSTYDQAVGIENVGMVQLSPAFTLNVNVKKNGAPANNVTVIAKPVNIADECLSEVTFFNDNPYFSTPPSAYRSSSLPAIVKVKTNSDGHVQIAGLSQCTNYDVTTLPVDENNDGESDFYSNTLKIDTPSVKKLAQTLELHPVENARFDLTTVVTAEGNAVANAKVVLYSRATEPGCKVLAETTSNSNYPPYYYETIYSNQIFERRYPTREIVTETSTDETGAAKLKNLPICSDYELIVLPFDSNNDGAPDYRTFSKNISYDGRKTQIQAATLTKISPSDYLKLVATNLMAGIDYRYVPYAPSYYYYNNSSSLYPPVSETTEYSITNGETIRLVFSAPLNETTWTIDYADDLIDPDQNNDNTVDVTFGQIKTIPVDVSYDATKTIVTIKPKSDLPANETLTLHAKLSTTDTSGTVDFSRKLYVEKSGDGNLAPNTISLSNDSGPNTPGNVYLEFPEVVTGSYQVLAIYNASGLKEPTTGERITFGKEGTTGTLAYMKSDASCTSSCRSSSGIAYRTLLGTHSQNNLNTGISLFDGDRVVIEVDIKDAKGNAVKSDIVLVVQ